MKLKKKTVFALVLTSVTIVTALVAAQNLSILRISSTGRVGGYPYLLGRVHGLMCSYLVFKNSTSTYMVNGTTGVIDWYDNDDAKVINAALGNLTTGRTWKEKVVLKGFFNVSSVIYVPSYTFLDLRSTVLKQTVTGAGYIIRNIDFVNGDTQIEIVGGEFNGNDMGTHDHSAICFKRVTHSRVRDVYVHNFSQTAGNSRAFGIFFVECKWTNLEYSRIEHCDHNGAIFTDCIECDIIGCRAYDNADGGGNPSMKSAHFTLFGNPGKGCYKCSIINCHGNKTSNFGIQIYRYCNMCTVQGCTIENWVNGGINVGGGTGPKWECYDNSVLNNLIKGKGQIGVEIRANRTVVSNNVFREVNIGIHSCYRGNSSVITNNQIYGFSIRGIEVYCSHNIISDNYIESSTASGPGIEVAEYYVYTIPKNNTVTNNIVYVKSYSGISLRNTVYNYIAGNTVVAGSGSYSIELNSGCNNNIVEFNSVADTVHDSGFNNLIRWNRGYVTENSGSTTVSSGENIAHGLVATPVWATVTCCNATYDGVPVVVSLDYSAFTSSTIQVSVYWTNGTEIKDDTILVMWEARTWN